MRRSVLATVGLVLLSVVAALATASASPDTVTVDSTTDVSDGDISSIANLVATPGDDGVISLREAIQAANGSAGPDTIEFDIPTDDAGYEVSGITGTWTIFIESSLPTLSGGGTVISGTTQADTNPDGPEIEISGASMGSGSCLVIGSAENVIHGLVINNCPANGITIIGTGATTNTVSGSYIGLGASGLSDLGNGYAGVEIREGAQGNTIGGDTPEERNVISGNEWDGVRISTGTGNTISGNYIGLDASGSSTVPNDTIGVTLVGAATNNVIGGDTAGERNIISGSWQNGVYLGGTGVISNTVSGNYIGTDVTGTLDRGNQWEGVVIAPGANHNTVGGDTEGERNIISANRRDGVVIYGTGTVYNVVSGNYIGTDATGTQDLGNFWAGVRITSYAQNNTVGGQTAQQRNVISGNGQSGVHIADYAQANTVSLNYIGADASGSSAALGNYYDGVRIDGAATNNSIGPDNLIVHNNAYGVRVYTESTTGNTITQNSIHSNAYDGIALLVGGNGYILAPAVSAANACFVAGSAGAGDTVEVFTGPDNEGKTYLNTALADGGGAWFVVGPFTLDTYVTATATDTAGNTSYFSPAPVPGTCHSTFVPLTMKAY